MKILSRETKGEATFDIINVIIMAILCFITLYPIWFVVVNSFNDGMDAARGGIYWWPRIFSLAAYKTVFANNDIITSFAVTVLKTVIGTVIHVFFTAMVAYPLSKRDLIGRKFYMTVGIITMFFSGGLIPTYLWYKQLHLIDNFAVYILPAMFSFYDLVIFMAFFREIPDSLEEAAKIDGSDDFKIFYSIILRLSLPVIATIALFHGVYQWNDYFTGVIYIIKKSYLLPIQTYLYKVVSENSANQAISLQPGVAVNRRVTSQTVKFATMVVTTFPIVCVYPFLQKYFVKGMMVGAVKG
ncbi:carbohydrate ABC transporter permease [Clostridium oryzae]|nr:carbohydrate ABC transporter permease [Clostridium oryzae]